MSTPKPVLIMNSVLAGAGVLLGGAGLAEFVDVKWIGLGNLLLAAIALGWAKYTEGQVTPNVAVAVSTPDLDKPLELVSGIAGPVPEGRPVDVTAAAA